MVVIVHEREAVNVGSTVSGGGPQELEEDHAVVIVGEGRSAIVPTLDHVQCRTRNEHSSSSRHAFDESKNRSELQPSANRQISILDVAIVASPH